MSITREGLEFSSDDVANWAAFLNTLTGQRLIPKVAESAPILLDGGDINKTLVRNGELRGFQEALKALLALTEVPQAPARSVEAYPDLDDNKAWMDF